MTSISRFFGEHRFLSNYHICEVHFEGKIYPSTEHAYQAAKTLDDDLREECRLLPTPKDARLWGQQIKIRSDWESIKFDVMYKVVSDKFKRSHDLINLLLATGSAELIEGNSWGDTYWGVCNGIGQNNLGKILMKIRAELYDEISRPAW